MIIQIQQYDPDYFTDNTFVLSDFETRDAPVFSRVTSLTATQWRNFTTTQDKLFSEPYANQIWTSFAQRTFDQVPFGNTEQTNQILAGNYGQAMSGSVQYPAQDNPVVRVNVASFDLTDTNATNNSTTPVVG